MTKKVELTKNVAPNLPKFSLGLAINHPDIINYPNQRHTGFVFLTHEKKPKLVHLGWKDTCSCDDLPDGLYAFNWLLDLPEQIVVPLITRLSLFAAKEPCYIPYSPVFSGKSVISEDFKFIPDLETPADGLSCATFTLIFLEENAIFLIDRSTWKVTEEDKQWFNSMLPLFKLRFKPHFYEKLVATKGEFHRYRPEQVVGAGCIFEDKSSDFETVNIAANEVLAELRRLQC